MANAHLWAEALAPGSEFTLERYGAQRPENESVASVRMTARVNAADAPEAESTVRLLLGQAMPSVTFTQVFAEAITGRYDAVSALSRCARSAARRSARPKKLIAGPGVYICDQCIEMMVEIIQEDVPPLSE